MSDGIDLIDTFRILWRWKKWIIFGTLVFMMGVIGVNRLRFKPNEISFEITAILEPGISEDLPNRLPQFLLSPTEIHKTIQSELHSIEIVKRFNQIYPNASLNKVNFESFVDVPVNQVFVKLKTADKHQGKNIMRLLLDVLNEIFQPKVKLRLDEITYQIGMKKDSLTLAKAELKRIETNIAKDIERKKTELELKEIVLNSLKHELNLIEPILSEQRSIIESYKLNFGHLFHPDAEVETEKRAPLQGSSVSNFNADISRIYQQFVSSLSNLAETESKVEILKAKVKQHAKMIDETNKELMTLQGALKTPLQSADFFPEYLRRYQEVEKIQEDIKRLQIEAENLQAVKLSKPIRVDEIKPVPPNYMFLATAGLAAGFIVMIFVVFCIEFLERYRASIRTSAKLLEKRKD